MVDSEVDRSFWENWEEIENQGAPNFTADLFEVFLQSSQDLYQNLSAAFIAQDNKKITYCAHSLKSSCHQMGAVGLAQLLESLEIQTRTTIEVPDPQLLEIIGSRLSRVQAELAKEVQIRRAAKS